MTAYYVPLLWCCLQAALVASLGLMAVWLLSRRAPASAAIAAASAMATIAAATVLVPVRLPDLAIWEPNLSTADQDGRAIYGSGAGGASQAPAETAEGFSLDVEAVVLCALMGGVGEAERGAAPQVGPGIVALLAFGAGIGMLSLSSSVRLVAQLRRGRTPIIDGEVLRLFDELKARLRLNGPVELCESAAASSPAMIGWRRPIVLLPRERAGWTDAQLRAALAHELAHVARGDYLWRVVATITRAVHFFHPLVHLLSRRLTLVQELATDRLAASVVGGSAAYLRALSGLAIRPDDQPRRRAAPIVLPALSSHLTRRIAMLRSKEGFVESGRIRFGGMAAAVLIAAVGTATMAARGSAEAVESPAAASPATSDLFSREPLDPALVGQSDKGLFVVRPAELAERPAFKPLFAGLNAFAAQAWRELFNVNVAPDIHLESIEYFAAAPELTFRAKIGETPEQRGRVMLGYGELVIGFPEEVAWRAWILEHVKGAEEVTERGISFIKLPVIPFLGSERACVAARDERTLVVTTGGENLRRSVQGRRLKGKCLLADTWPALDGGLATVLVSVDLGPSDVAPKESGARLMVEVLENIERFGAAFDLDASSNQSEIRLVMTCPDHESAERVREVIETSVPLAVVFMENAAANPPQIAFDDEAERESWTQTAGTPETGRQVARWYHDLLQSCAFRLEARPDGMVDVRISAKATFPETIYTAFEREEIATSPKAERR